MLGAGERSGKKFEKDLGIGRGQIKKLRQELVASGG